MSVAYGDHVQINSINKVADRMNKSDLILISDKLNSLRHCVMNEPTGLLPFDSFGTACHGVTVSPPPDRPAPT